MSSDSFHMPIRLTLKPGENGTKKLMQDYGDKLVCVRYRYNDKLGVRLKTVELIEEVAEWQLSSRAGRNKLPSPTDRFGIQVGFEEKELREQVKQIGGIWRPRHKLWELTYAQIEALGLQDRIVQGEGAI